MQLRTCLENAWLRLQTLPRFHAHFVSPTFHTLIKNTQTAHFVQREKISMCISSCENWNTQCPDESMLNTGRQLCGNGIHEFSEEWDTSDLASPLHKCCINCKLQTGFYTDPPCSTRCGDFLVANNVEECDSPGDFSCNMYTCKNQNFRQNVELWVVQVPKYLRIKNSIDARNVS